MDKEFLVGCLCALAAFLGLTASITTYCIENGRQQIQFAQGCEAHGRGVVYENVNDNLVSECK